MARLRTQLRRVRTLDYPASRGNINASSVRLRPIREQESTKASQVQPALTHVTAGREKNFVVQAP